MLVYIVINFVTLVFLFSGADTQNICNTVIRNIKNETITYQESYLETYHGPCYFGTCLLSRWKTRFNVKHVVRPVTVILKVCCNGYRPDNDLSERRGTLSCIPVCRNGCQNGTCVAPDTCECDSGYVLMNETCQPDDIKYNDIDSLPSRTAPEMPPLVTYNVSRYYDSDIDAKVSEVESESHTSNNTIPGNITSSAMRNDTDSMPSGTAPGTAPVAYVSGYYASNDNDTKAYEVEVESYYNRETDTRNITSPEEDFTRSSTDKFQVLASQIYTGLVDIQKEVKLIHQDIRDLKHDFGSNSHFDKIEGKTALSALVKQIVDRLEHASILDYKIQELDTNLNTDKSTSILTEPILTSRRKNLIQTIVTYL